MEGDVVQQEAEISKHAQNLSLCGTFLTSTSKNICLLLFLGWLASHQREWSSSHPVLEAHSGGFAKGPDTKLGLIFPRTQL